VITEVRVRYFKRFEDQTFHLNDSLLLAGPNNTGKTTLLQAIATWHFALEKWKLVREKKKSSAKRYTGTPITRQEFLALPVRELNLLWYNTSTAHKRSEGKTPGSPRPMSITLKGHKANDGQPWEHTMEFRYSNAELVYTKPASGQEAPEDLESVVYVPSFSGIETEEKVHTREYQDWLIGQGKPGDIIRNLLVDVCRNSEHWESLKQQLRELFHYTLLKPEHAGRPYILSEYLPGLPEGRGRDGLPRLDIANAGSGFLQVLLLLAFFYSRRSSVLLLDEPDAHQHVSLQGEIYNRLRELTRKQGCQLIIATHSEVLINCTDPENVLSFYGDPRILGKPHERNQVREALKKISTIDMVRSRGGQGSLC